MEENVDYQTFIAKDCQNYNTALIAIGSNQVKSQQFSWAVLQHTFIVPHSSSREHQEHWSLVPRKAALHGEHQHMSACQALPVPAINIHCTTVPEIAFIFWHLSHFSLKAQCYTTTKHGPVENYRRPVNNCQHLSSGSLFQTHKPNPVNL